MDGSCTRNENLLFFIAEFAENENLGRNKEWNERISPETRPRCFKLETHEFSFQNFQFFFYWR